MSAFIERVKVSQPWRLLKKERYTAIKSYLPTYTRTVRNFRPADQAGMDWNQSA